MKKTILRNVIMFIFSAMLVISVTPAQEKPKKINHSKECKCEKCVDTLKMKKCKDGCECAKCTSVKKAKIKKCKEGCECVKCTEAKKMKMEKHPADCSCNKCKSASKTSVSGIWNSHCPIGEEPVDPKTATIKYKGKVIGFCCPGCEKKFMKEPAKYMKKFDSKGNLINKT